MNEYFVISIIFCLMSVCIILLIKLISVKHSVRSMAKRIVPILQTDTNQVLSISTTDKDVRLLAKTLNHSLIILRTKELRLNLENTEIGNAITNISHDLRTPLTAVRGYLDLMKNTDDKKTMQRYLSVLDERTKAMQDLTEELFRYSILSNDEVPSMVDISLNASLEDALAGAYTLLTEKGIEPCVSITAVQIHRRLNKEALARIFGNMLSNAAKYSSGDLNVTLNEKGTVIFENTAPDLDEIVVSRLFDRFYTVSNARSATGLGLSIARHLTEQMGGNIKARYENGKLKILVDFPE